MSKEKQLEFLERKLQEKVESRLMGEITKRSMQGLALAYPADDSIRKTHLTTIKMNELVDKEISTTKQLIEEIKEGKYEI